MIDGEYEESTEEQQLLFAAKRALNIYRSITNIRDVEGYMIEEINQTYKRLCKYFERKNNE